MRVLIADDHELIREGLRRALVGTSEITEVGEAITGQQAIDMVRQGSWSVLILDINLPGKSGFDVLTELRQEKHATPVLVLSMHSAATFGVRALQAGAAGYLSKTAPTDELLKALRKIAGGGKFISQEIAEELAVQLQGDPGTPPHTLLSEREFQVFLLIGSGKTVGEIARQLNINVKTVSTHRSHIMEKMQLKNNAQIMQYVVTQDLLS
jgi:two-component system, NarL family, invasion response regulator UvrY